LKKFSYPESNNCIDLGIKVEKLKKLLNKKLDEQEITILQFQEYSKNLNTLILKNIELVEDWEEKLKGKGNE
jgi:protein associated with RNAse G/E